MASEVNTNGSAQTKPVDRLYNRLNEEKIVSSLDRLLDRLDAVESAVANLTTLMQQGPGLVAMTMDMADEAVKSADKNGVSVEQRLGAALQIAEKLTAPEMVQKLDGLLTMANQAPGLMAMTMDMVDDGFKSASDKGINIEARLGAALQIAEKLTAPEMVKKIDGLINMTAQAEGLMAMTMDVVDDELKNFYAKEIDVKTLLILIEALSISASEAKNMPRAKVGGIFSMMRTMKDPDRQKAIGYIMNIAKAFGQKL